MLNFIDAYHCAIPLLAMKIVRGMLFIFQKIRAEYFSNFSPIIFMPFLPGIADV
jgi:hypothetical protein